MSWFNETFGDSLNSLKGQITKITKEVLADDEATNSERQDSEKVLVKELEALCESKDLEIASLREEFSKLHSQYNSQLKSLGKGNKIDDDSSTSDSVDSQVKKLESELVQLRQERDHLNSCLDELQSEHKINLNQVISLKDKYKSELEALKKEISPVKNKLVETPSESNTREIDQDETNEISVLNSKLNALQLELEEEREKSKTAVRAKEENQNSLKGQLEKLLEDIQIISKGKTEIEEKLQKINNENKDLRGKLVDQENEMKQNEIKLKLLLNEKEELLKKCEQQELVKSELSGLMKTEDAVEQKLKNLLEMLNVDGKEIIKENNIIGLINLIENKVYHSNKQIQNWMEMKNYLDLEIKKLKEENADVHNKLKIFIENSSEMEKKYQDEILLLKNSLSEMKTQEQDCINQSQTDDVKRLEQEIAQCMSLILAKNNEVTEYSVSVKNLEQELKSSRELSLNIEKELVTSKEDKKKLDEENHTLKNSISKMTQENVELKRQLEVLESEKINLTQASSQLQTKIAGLEVQVGNLSSGSEMLKEELNKASLSKSEADGLIQQLQNENVNLKNEFQNVKAQVIIKDSKLMELMKSNEVFQEEIRTLQTQNNQLLSSEQEINKWKDTSVDLQIQKEDLIVRKEELENECLKLKNDLVIGLGAKDAEIENLKLTNANLMKSYNELHNQLENKAQAESLSASKGIQLDETCQKQADLILQLQEENSELKSRVQKFQEQIKMQMLQSQSVLKVKEDVQQHRRSKSAVDSEASSLLDQKSGAHSSEDILLIKQALQQEQTKCQLLQHQFQDISNKEASARKEFERLKQHLIEVEDHYTEEAVENEKVINDLKSKLVAAEEQLQNSSTLYTSLKVRDNQHLESLQSQLKMVSAQRDDLQAKVSTAEDEIQKHKASLMSLQIVLEQFQQDKEREIEEVAMKYEKQLQLSSDQFKNLELEIQSLSNQLGEAKNGLKAASRLGEQLEKKTQQVSELEEKLNIANSKVAELEGSLETANQANNGKVDKLLIKNLVVGYILSANAERKAQVLRIMASVLDFDQEERNKMGVDANRTKWLSSILHPKADDSPNNQSLAEAFIKFLENESRPQPQLKLLPEQLDAGSSKTSRTSPKPSGRLSELTLPTFNSSQENESSSILKNVLKDS